MKWHWDIQVPALPKPSWSYLPGIDLLDPPEPTISLRRAEQAVAKMANEYETMVQSREDYILELRAKLKRASETLGPMARHLSREIERNAKRERKLERSIERQAVVARGVQRSHEETCSVMGQAILGLKEKLKLASVDQQALADAKANAESLERGLPAAVEAATARLRDELATTRRYVCELITGRDAAKKERDEAVASHANVVLRLANAQHQLMNARPPGALLEENEKLRTLSSEACAERESLRGQLAIEKSDHEHVRLLYAEACRSGRFFKDKLDAVDECMRGFAYRGRRARDVVKELCRLRGISR